MISERDDDTDKFKEAITKFRKLFVMPGGGEAGQLLLLQLLEGQGAAAGLAVPQHQPPLLLLPYLLGKEVSTLLMHQGGVVL